MGKPHMISKYVTCENKLENSNILVKCIQVCKMSTK